MIAMRLRRCSTAREPMFEQTAVLLRSFYTPFDAQLSVLLGDTRFEWRTSSHGNYAAPKMHALQMHALQDSATYGGALTSNTLGMSG